MLLQNGICRYKPKESAIIKITPKKVLRQKHRCSCPKSWKVYEKIGIIYLPYTNILQQFNRFVKLLF